MERKEKILIFSTAYYPFVGGAEVAIKEVTDRITDLEFDLITARFKRGLPKFERVGNVNVYRLGIGVPILDKLLLPLKGALLASRLNRENIYKFYWCIMVSFASGSAYIANKFSKEKVPIILTLQEGDSEKHFGRRWFGLINLSWGLALRSAKLVTAISSYLANRAREFGYMGELKIVPNGVDVKSFELRDFSLEERKKTREGLGLGEGDVALITASRLVEKNGIGDVIEALKFLPENIKFIIIGSGELERSLKLKAESLGLGGRVVFKGFVEHSELPKYLKSCDIFVRASLSEGLGNAFLEAMACKLPVIATPVGGILDFVKEGETGYFCEPRNPESVSEAVKKTIADPNKSRVIENAYKMVAERYDWDLIAQQMKEIF